MPFLWLWQVEWQPHLIAARVLASNPSQSCQKTLSTWATWTAQYSPCEYRQVVFERASSVQELASVCSFSLISTFIYVVPLFRYTQSRGNSSLYIKRNT